ncbi:Capsule polysaccharide biosynthesis protein [Legionella massiliensis]|uniref:Capsule polysaccharide biosynthesis protein n=1 Tax=Legionella massiliensis TaxID=1034943 RepID=A0A078KVU0_9GAMM|nr:capsular biosynthesis protein [Legionella massiliensis]CDZ77122.1 Capsule polysaccharide biosynthesis protein [Legionella massiliensis]CEE12860.1 Capsule polysaccharide biosynthesis protein [Legionella massiliensis]
MSKRRFLLLQGVASPFFARLGDKLQEQGHSVFKINFNGGDLAYWGTRSAWSYRQDIKDLPDYLNQKYSQFAITDQILFGDCRPIHQVATSCAITPGIRTHVFEEGYFRPYWVTLEQGGVNKNSRLPRCSKWFWEVGKHVPEYQDGVAFSPSFRARVVHDVCYRLAGISNPILFSKYKTHKGVIAVVAGMAYARRFSQLLIKERQEAKKKIAKLLEEGVPYFFLPLQISDDAQITSHSSFSNMSEVILTVMTSFAKNVPANTSLVIKNHPLDYGLTNYAAVIKKLAKELCLENRIVYLESGDLNCLVQEALGVITVNSTVGSFALGLGCPTIALADAIYNLPDLTFQGALDDFWGTLIKPNAQLYQRFRNTVIHTTQINGGFYSKSSIKMAVENCLTTLTQRKTSLDLLL